MPPEKRSHASFSQGALKATKKKRLQQLPQSLSAKEREKLDRAFHLSMMLWLSAIFVAFSFSILGVYLTRKFSPHSFSSPLVYTLLFFVACLFLGGGKFFYETFLDKKRVQKLDVDAYAAHYCFTHALVFGLVDLIIPLGTGYSFFSGEEQNLGFFLVAAFAGLFLFIPKKSDFLVRFLYRR